MSQSRDGSKGSSSNISDASLEDQVLLLVAQLMEAGQDDEDTCRALDHLTKLLSEEQNAKIHGQQSSQPLHEFIDADGFDTILGYLDMRNDAIVRGHATLTVSAYLKASEQKGTEHLSEFFKSRVSKGTYDDFIVAFSVAACIFPVVPSVSAELFLTEGFVNSLGPLMKRRWKSKKVEQSCLEMLNAACMDTACREAINKYCTDWLEDIVIQHAQGTGDIDATKSQTVADEGTRHRQTHSETVRNLAAVILAKIQVRVGTSHCFNCLLRVVFPVRKA
jgi:protein unc-45